MIKTSLQRKLWGQRELLVAFYFIFVVFCLWSFAGHPNTALDFTAYLQATSEFLNDRNPYAIALSTNPFYRFYSPPHVFGILAPITVLRDGIEMILAGKGFLTLFALTFCGCGVLLFRIFLKDLQISSQQLLYVLLLITPYGLIYHALIWGSLSWIPLLGITGLIFLWRQRLHFCAGLVTYFCLLRVHQLLLPLGYCILHSVRAREIRVLFGMCAGALLCSGVILFINPDLIFYYLSAAELQAKYIFATVTIPSLLPTLLEIANYSRSHALFITSGAFLCIFAFAYWKHSNTKPENFIPFVLPFSLCLGPYAWFHDYLLCLPTQFFCARILMLAVQKQSTKYVLVLGSALLIENLVQTYTAAHADGNELFAAYYILPALFLCVLSLLAERIRLELR
jgi:hypothetical protein